MNDASLEQRLIAHVSAPDYRPAKPGAIGRQLNLDADQRHQLKRLIKRLVKAQRLRFGERHLVLPAAVDTGSEQNNTGVFRKAIAGFGFVSRPNGDAAAGGADIFIPADKIHDAADGDTVRFRLSKRRDRLRRLSGEIVEVIQRRTHRFVGTYLEHGTNGYVQVDGSVFEQTVWVGDAGAKNARDGDKVVIEMVRFPTTYRAGEAVIVEVLGDRKRAGVDTLTVIHQHQLPTEFPSEVMDDARRQADKFDAAIGSERTDLTKETVITIDPHDARDFDDAISLQRIERGHWRLGVHIADVSHFVPLNSALDLEARRRGTSVYLPDRVLPMLPETISNNLASLQPDRVRYTMSVLIEFDSEGRPVTADWFRGAIRSAHRFTYEEIDAYLADDQPWKKKLSPDVFELVRRMHDLAMMLRRRRMARGAIELHLPEVKIELADDGKVRGASVQENTESHQVIEEFMLAANEAVARKLSVDHSINVLRRIHEPPSPIKLRQLTEFVQALGLRCDSLESRFEIKRLIEQTAGKPESAAVNMTVLRSMQKAVYSPRNVGHYALHSDHYCHFTSPIRRYPDLVVHRMVGDLIDGRRPVDDFGQLTRLGEHCSQTEQRAERAERDLIRLKLLNYLVDKIGMSMNAVITGVESVGLFALCQELPIDGLLPVDQLPRDRYYFDRTARSLIGHNEQNSFRIGDRIAVRVAMVDPDRRELELELVRKFSRKAPSHRPASARKTSKAKKKPSTRTRHTKRRRRR